MRFTVQYTVKDAREFLYENRDPEQAVMLAAESAVREIVGRSKMDAVLYEQRDQIPVGVAKSIQVQLDRLKAGVQVKNVTCKACSRPSRCRPRLKMR